MNGVPPCRLRRALSTGHRARVWNDRRRLVALWLLFSSGLAPAGRAATPDSVYTWPLAAPPQLTSTFGEYRPGHFHAGIDLSTFGREGIPVRAVEEGEVVRVRAGARGYGRAIYLRLRDGRLAVYAHLSAYMEPLAEYVADTQEQRQSYRVDLYPERGRFPVRRGQVIGLSGASGAGGAHLHFELREGDVPINPLTHGLETTDRQGPLFRAVVITPLDHRARIDGTALKRRYPLVRRDGVLTTAEEITVWGPIVLGADGFDRAGERASRLGVYEATLWRGESLLSRTRFERFDYAHDHEVHAEFDLEEIVAGRRHVLNLFVPPVAGDFHQPLPPRSGWLSAGIEGTGEWLEPGLHELTVHLVDAAGNRATARIPLRVTPPVECVGATIERVGSGDTGEERVTVTLDWREGAGARGVRTEVGQVGGGFELHGEYPIGPERRVELPLALFEPPAPAVRLGLIDDRGRVSNTLALCLPIDPEVEKGGAVAPAPEPRDTGSSFPGRWQLDPGARIARLHVLWDTPLVTPPRATLGGEPLGPPVMLDAHHSRFVLPATGGGPLTLHATLRGGHPVEWTGSLDWERAPREAPVDYRGAGGRVRIRLPHHAFFEDAYVWAGSEGAGRSPELPAGLESVGPVVRCEPEGLPLDHAVEVSIRVPPGTTHDRLGLYRLEPDEHTWEGATWEASERLLTARVRRVGRFVLARDLASPRLEPVVPPAGGSVPDGRPLFRARVADEESGLVEAEVLFLIDGDAVPTEWDPDADEMRYRPRVPLAPGSHTLELRATDRAGNRSSTSMRIVVPGR